MQAAVGGVEKELWRLGVNSGCSVIAVTLVGEDALKAADAGEP